MKTDTMHNCRYRGCQKSFGTEQGLRMHIGRVHTHAIVNGHRENGDTDVDVTVKPKRKYTRKAVRRIATAKGKYQLNFCNHCGMPLGAVKVALEMT